MKKLNFLIGSGPTREYIDPVRFITNASSGKMGAAIANAAISAGHNVKIVSGPVNIKYPLQAEVEEVTTAVDMYKAVMDSFAECDVIIMTAAVCDYRPARMAPQKIHKSDQTFILRLERNPDILFEISRINKDKVIVGFAAETNDIIVSARRKLEKKNMDLIIANEVGNSNFGFGAEKIKATMIFKTGESRELGQCKKKEVAKIIIEESEKFYNQKPNT